MNKTYDFNNYRDFLRARLAERIERNPGYSLRAMARDLGLSVSMLSETLSGKASLSPERARKISKSLNLKSTESRYFVSLVELESTHDLDHRAEILAQLKKLNPQRRPVTDLSIEQFKQWADWYHHAILELALLPDFQIDANSVARSLRIPQPTAQSAIDRLLTLGLLQKGESGKLIRKDIEFRIRSELKNAAFRQFYRQMFDKASRALEEQSPQERLSGFLSLPLNQDALAEIDNAITKFFEEVRTISSKYENESQVYHLMVHFFNLTKRGEQNVTQKI